MYLNIKISSRNQLNYLKSLCFAVQCAKWYITSLCFNLIGLYEVHMISGTRHSVHYDPICQVREHFYFYRYAKTKHCLQQQWHQRYDLCSLSYSQLCLFTVNMRLLTSSQVTNVSKEVTKGQLEKVRQSKWSLTLSWWKEWAEKADKEASWTLVWLLVWYSGVCVKSEMPHF